jgi:hypothetical protein
MNCGQRARNAEIGRESKPHLSLTIAVIPARTATAVQVIEALNQVNARRGLCVFVAPISLRARCKAKALDKRASGQDTSR